MTPENVFAYHKGIAARSMTFIHVGIECADVIRVTVQQKLNLLTEFSSRHLSATVDCFSKVLRKALESLKKSEAP